MPTGRNPVWQRDELILALEVYFRWRPKVPPAETHPDVVELSELLQNLPLIPAEDRRESFRNPSGVYMKLANFQYLDPTAEGGLDAYGKRDAEVWDEFAEHPAQLQAAAREIRHSATQGKRSS